MPSKHIVVIGASAGGIEALRIIAAALHEDFPAPICIVLHTAPQSPGLLDAILSRAGALPATNAVNGERLRPGHIYVAPPDFHLVIEPGVVRVTKGPRENRFRPAIDPLFRSAAASFGSRVIGVVLSGSLSDGTAGLRAIKRCAGLAVVQKPEEALAPSMPRNALRRVEVDHVRAIADMPALLSRLARERADPAREAPLDIRLEAAIAAQELADMKVDDTLGQISPFTCPECHGALWEIRDGPMLRYRCHAGHAYTADAVLAAQGDEIDRMLGTLQRAHQERAAFARRMAQQERAEQRHTLADRLETRAREYEEDAKLVLELIRNGFGAAAADDETAEAGGNGKDET